QEGSVVDNGQILLIMDQTAHQSAYNQTKSRLDSLAIKIARLQAEAAFQAPIYSHEMLQNHRQTIESEIHLYQSRKNRLESELKVLENQVTQRKQELEVFQVNLETAKRGIRLAYNEMDLIKPLVEKGLEPKMSLLHLEQRLSDLTGDRLTALHSIERTRSAIEEVQSKKKETGKKFREQLMAELSENMSKYRDLEQSLPALQDKVSRTDVKSPVRGIVNRILATTIGGVIKPGEPIVEVVPLDDTLLIEAKIRPQDIGFLYPGQKVMVKFTAYDFSKYGGLEGKLETIGADSVVDKESGQSMFPIQIRTNTNELVQGEEIYQIIPGMVTQVDIITGKQTILDYLVLPVLRVKSMAFQE
ncbi:MAG: HlyD family type I secretion periplasmic adaptor subunit, partial [Magnetococcales bacterium]|nr:HlyD family type I secretion periplasmic adaptor subunit [Magnetococcales bacterium]